MKLPNRTFEVRPARRERVPLLIGLTGPSGGGKTYSALRLATGIQQVSGGEIYFIDTESRRALHYADRFKFQHIPFDAPFGSLDYLVALQQCVKAGAGVVIVDSMSHEHEGPGGLMDLHDQAVQRMAGDDYAKRERVKMLAWSEPKAKRRQLINGILQLNCNFIFCFRAKNSSKPMKN
ncbi:MAG: AAA family ATPase, partial [Sphingopyxis terrae]|nr:AAA family ATPase [Sphingopyxis terrae]